MTVPRELRRRLRADHRLPRFEPCLPRPAKEPPTGPDWIHEIKHDGFRIIARRDAAGVRLITRNGYDLAARFPLAAAHAWSMVRPSPSMTMGFRCSTSSAIGARIML